MLRRIGASQIEGICRVKIRVDADAVLAQGSGRDAASAAATELRRAAEAAKAAGGEIETLHPIADLKVQKLDLVTAVRERQTLLARRAAMPCHRCGTLHRTPLGAGLVLPVVTFFEDRRDSVGCVVTCGG